MAMMDKRLGSRMFMRGWAIILLASLSFPSLLFPFFILYFSLGSFFLLSQDVFFSPDCLMLVGDLVWERVSVFRFDRLGSSE